MRIRIFSNITLICLSLLFDVKSISAQEPIKTPSFFSINYRTGENRPHRDIIKNLNYPYRGIEFKMGWQSIGNKSWQQAYRYPSYGIGINWNTFNTEILGEPFAAYFYTNFPQLTTKWARLDLEIDFGASYGINPYDSIVNPNNYSTGSSINAFFGAYLEQSFHITNSIDLFASEGLTHYSNGALGFPNLGLNIPSLKFGVRYCPNATEKLPKSSLPVVNHHWQINTQISFGAKTFKTPTPYYKEALIAPTFYYRTSYKRRVGIGFEGAFNEIFKGHYNSRDYTGEQLLTAAVFASHEFIIERFTIVTQFGIYLYNKPLETFYYEKIGMGFYITPAMRLTLGVKAHYIKAEYIETGIIFDINLD